MTAHSHDPNSQLPAPRPEPAHDWVGSPSGGAACFALAPLALASMSGADILTGAMVLVLLVLSVSAHEAAHAWAALKCGDSTGRDLGRLTLNPIPHIDPWMTLIVPGFLYFATQGAFVFGGAKPVPVLFHRLRNPWRDMSLVALAGPLTNLLIGVLLLVAWHWLVQKGWYNGAAPTPGARRSDVLPVALRDATNLNFLLFVFNLVPIPPLDGSRVMAWLLPSNVRESYVALERWGMMIVIGLMLLYRPFGNMLRGALEAVRDAFEHLLRTLHVIL